MTGLRPNLLTAVALAAGMSLLAADAYGSPRNEKPPDTRANTEIVAETEPDTRPRPLNT